MKYAGSLTQLSNYTRQSDLSVMFNLHYVFKVGSIPGSGDSGIIILTTKCKVDGKSVHRERFFSFSFG
jgi:hypothetical protein